MAGRRSLLLLVAVGTLTAGTLAEPRVSYGNQEPTLCPQKVLVKTQPVDLSLCYIKQMRIVAKSAVAADNLASAFAGRAPLPAPVMRELGAAAAQQPDQGGFGGASWPLEGGDQASNMQAYSDQVTGSDGAAVDDAQGSGRSKTVMSYNTLLGSTIIGPSYKFTSDPSPLEGAKVMAASGARVHKFSVDNWLDAAGTRRPASLLEAVTQSQQRYVDVLDQPMDRFVFWAYPVTDAIYQEFYDLAAFLIKRYAGTGKSFFIGHWEGDWAIRDNYKDPIMPGRVEYWTHKLSEVQRAIDTAKADAADLVNGGAGVRVWGYAEVNRVLTAMGNSSYPAFINQIVPNINPPIDFISYSNWEIEEAQQRSADEIGTVLGDALDFINCHLPPKPCVPEPRVFVGEFGYFLRNNNCTAADAPPVKAGQGPHMDTTSEIIKQRTLWHAASAIAWGSPMNLYWELYSNEKGTDAKGQRCDKGYWLVNDQGQDEPVFAALKAYYSAADAFVRRHARAHGGAAPDINAFRRWAVAKLADLTGYVGVAPPKVRELDPAAALIAGGH